MSEITHPDKEIFKGIKKKDIVGYYSRISRYIIPYLKDRPLSVKVYPNGIEKSGFYMKNEPEYFPKWINTTRVKRRKGGSIRQVVCNDAKTLSYLANNDCLELNVPLSKSNNLERADKIIFDLDGEDFKKIKEAAFLIKEILDEKEIKSSVVLTGSRGLHIIIPIKEEKFEKTKAFALKIAEKAVDKSSGFLTTEQRKEKRGKRIFIDTMRNNYGQTAICPYSIRALDGAPVAVPIEWDELKGINKSGEFNIKNIFDRVREKGDVLSESLKRKNRIP